MTTLTLESTKLTKTSFVDLKELFDYAIDNQIISELGFIDKDELSKKSRILFDNLKDNSDLINI